MEMEIISNDSADEREEGEIVDDELEDVSDDSIIIPGSPLDSGKSVSSPEPLSAICLSSEISSEADSTNEHFEHKESLYHNERKRKMCKKRQKLRQTLKKKCHHRSRRKRRTSLTYYYITDSESDTIDPKYAKQLREALKHESSKHTLHNSLRTRLKSFIDDGSKNSDDLDLNALRDAALASTIKGSNSEIEESDCCKLVICSPPLEEEIKTDSEDSKNSCLKENENEIDPELQELRIAALKSVVIKKFGSKKRKAVVRDNQSGTSNKDQIDINKENDQRVINSDGDNWQNKKLKIDDKKDENYTENSIELDKPILNESVQQEDNLEEDPDIMRAKLLASITKKLTSIPSIIESHTISPKLHTVEKKPAATAVLNAGLKIVNIKNKFTHTSAQTVTVKPLIININADSDSDTDIALDETKRIFKENLNKFLKERRTEVEELASKTHTLTANFQTSTSNLKKTDSLLDKSAVKLLPKSQQLEYRKLKQILLARKKARIRKNSQRLVANKKEILNNKLPKVKTDIVVNNSIDAVNNRKVVKSTHFKNGGLADLEKTLDDMQTLENGRLQMKGKYRLLVPLINKINHASDEKLKHETAIRTLLQELQKLRTKLATSHQNFVGLVQELVSEKNKIDQCIIKVSKLTPSISASMITSTPNKPSIIGSPKNVEEKISIEHKVVAIKQTNQSEINEKMCTENTNLPKENELCPNDVNKLENHETEAENLLPCNNKLESHPEEILLNPNDVTKVFTEEESCSLPKYISPLGSRGDETDPLVLYCPYDLLGVCKDKECPYAHCS